MLVELTEHVNHHEIRTDLLEHCTHTVTYSRISYEGGRAQYVRVRHQDIRWQDVSLLLELRQTITPDQFRRIQLYIQDTGRSGRGASQDGVPLRQLHGNLEGQERLAHLGRAQQDHNTGLRNEVRDQPLDLGPVHRHVLGQTDNRGGHTTRSLRLGTTIVRVYGRWVAWTSNAQPGANTAPTEGRG